MTYPTNEVARDAVRGEAASAAPWRLRRERGDPLDPSGAADGASDRNRTVVRWRCGFRRISQRGDRRPADQSPRSGDLLRPMAVRQESIVADAGKSAWQDVHQESADEFFRRERHRLLSVVEGVILPLEGDMLAVEGRQARIGDRRAMGVAGQILEHLLGSAKGWLGVDDPVGSDRLDQVIARRHASASRSAEPGRYEKPASVER